MKRGEARHPLRAKLGGALSRQGHCCTGASVYMPYRLSKLNFTRLSQIISWLDLRCTTVEEGFAPITKVRAQLVRAQLISPWGVVANTVQFSLT